MAFVSQAQRNLHYYNKATQKVGPGYYQATSPKNKQQCATAPFNSSSVKRTIYDQKNILLATSSQRIGPGYYNVDNTFIKNNIQTYVNNKSVIVKINTLGNNQFESTVPRFKSLQKQTPGPGQYQKDFRSSTFTLQTKKYSLQKRRVLKQRIHQFIQDLKWQKKIPYKPSIPSKTFILQKNQNRFRKGYKQREIKSETIQQQRVFSNFSQNKSPKKAKCLSWAKSQRKYLNDVKINASQRNIGPGKYLKQSQQNQKQNNISNNARTNFKKRSKTESSTFKSKSVRTFFDSLYYETNLKQIADLRNREDYKTENPGPGYYDVEVGINKRSEKNRSNIVYQFFGSTVERFPTQPQPQITNINIFPFKKSQKSGTLEIKSHWLGENKTFNRKKTAFLSDIQRKKIYLKEEEYIPGPGQYDSHDLKTMFKPKRGKIPQNFGSSKQRFQQQKIQHIQPSNIAVVDIKIKEQQSFRKKVVNQSFMFKSKIKKQILNQKQQTNHIFGKYDVTQNDLSSKIAKQSLFLQNLRKIQVQIPAFNSNIPRFQYSKQRKSKSQQRQLGLNYRDQNQKNKNKNSLFVNTMTEDVRYKILQKNKQQVTKCKKSTIYNQQSKNDRFQNIKLKNSLRNPGVGEYSLRSNWTKQSYNVKYHQNYAKNQKPSC